MRSIGWSIRFERRQLERRMGEQTHLLIGTPCYGGLVHQRYVQSVITLLQRGPAAGFNVLIEMLGYGRAAARWKPNVT